MNQNFSSIFKSLKNFWAVGIVMIALVGCSGSSTPSSTPSPSSPTNNPGNTSPSTTNNSTSGTVVSRIEKSGAIDYKIYLQPDANGSNRKGIVLLGSGNNEVALDGPSVGSLDGPMENNTANELAKQGYVAAIVAYRKHDSLLILDAQGKPVLDKDGNVQVDGNKWNSASGELALDMSNVADTIIATYGSGLSRSKVITGGVSYTSFMLLTENGGGNKLADTRGILATCGSTGSGDINNFKVPVYGLSCSGRPECDPANPDCFSGKELSDAIPAGSNVKGDSDGFTDPACNTHCGGDLNLWTGKMVQQVQKWVP